jgi:hypothetical protein
MLEGACHCGRVSWRCDATPGQATACNCTICRRYGVIWGYGYDNEDVHVSGETQVYAWGEKSIGFHFCASCGCVAYWRSIEPNAQGRRRVGFNLRLAEPETVGAIAVEHFDGLHWVDGPVRGDVADLWY